MVGANIPLPGRKPKEGAEPAPMVFEDWGGLDTKARRPAIKPKDFYWIENWMPIGPGNLRTLYDKEETPIYTAADPRTIVYYTFYNLGADEFCAAFLDDGTAVQINTDTLATTTISAAANTFYDGGTLPQAVQYQSKYLAICSQVDDNAYWIWDGTSLFGAGTLAPRVLLTSTGQGTGYASAPTVTAYGGSGSGATFTAVLDPEGHVTDVLVTDPGSGYNHEDLVTLVFTGGGGNDQARATATVNTAVGGVAIIHVTNGGTGYTNPTVTFAGGGGTGATAFVSGVVNGVITEITVTHPGVNYTSAPTVTIGGGGASATAVAEIRRGQITGITVNSGGAGYVGQPQIIISGPNDLEFPAIQAEAYATLTAGAVSAITLTNNGVGYRSATVQVSGGNDSAEAEVSLMPYGIQGSTLEVYSERVWVFNDTKLSATGPGSVSEFGGDAGGVSSPITDSNLREKVVRAIAANGFLYRLGDSNVASISNVQVSAQGVTTFNTSNVDPQVGTAWRDSVAAFGRALVFANPTGVYALFGGAAEKVSQSLDGLFAKASFNTGEAGLTPTAAVANIFGIKVYCLEFTTVDPRTGAARDVICMWDGQDWFVGSQTFAPEFLAGQEINSQLTAYGASETEIYRLFKTPSTDLTKVFMTKLAATPSYILIAQVSRVYFIAQDETGETGTLDIAIENQAGPNTAQARPIRGGILTFIGAGGVPIQFLGAASADLNFTTRGLVIDGYDESQYGQLIGATVTTTMSDLTLISLTVLLVPYSANA